MVFWRKKKNATEQEKQEQEDRVIHHPDEPAIEPPTEYEAELGEQQKHDIFEETEEEIIEELEETPVPEITREIAEEDEELEKPEDKKGWFSRVTDGLSKSSTKFTQGITDLVTKKKLDQEMLDELEDILITADLGPKTAARIVQDFSKDRFGKDISENEIKEVLASSIAKILEPVAKAQDFALPESGKPHVVLVVGVNGVGKTTTIGKIAHDLHNTKKRPVMIAAADTFRAAAIEQLEVWADRVGCPFVKKDIGADAAAVSYESYEKARQEGTEVLFIDTAGRLHNKSNLMAELEKIVRVLKKQDEALPHSVLLVLDATTGQNAFEQVRIFKETMNVTGLIVTKLDGSAKGGVVVGLADQFGLPIHMIGVGEKIDDLQPFDAGHFANSLVGMNS